jgi:aspartate-semialdehyde dehydrogenase
MKLVHETHKILGDNSIGITATAVRIPVVGGHSEAVNIEFEKEFDVEQIREILEANPGVEVQDNPSTNFIRCLFCRRNDAVFVGRIRRDTSHPKAVNMWIVADNLRKGAATNTIQIAEYLISNELVSSN